MGDIGEGTAVDEGRRVFERLEQIGFECLAQQHRHCTGRFEILGGDGSAVFALADHHACQPRPQIVDIARQRQHGHHLGGDGDVEADLARRAIGFAAQADDDVA